MKDLHALLAACAGLLRARMTAPFLVAAGLLAGSIVLSAIIVFWRSRQPRTWREFLSFALPRHILTHRSARADILFWVSRKLLVLPLSLPAGISAAIVVGTATHSGLAALLGLSTKPAGEPGYVILAAFTASMLLAYDLSYYLYHTLQHRVPILWELHKVHHSAEVMVGTTKDRIHPLDEVMNKVWDGLVTGPVYGVWMFAIASPVELTILGINIYILRNIIMMDFVRHTHLKISFGLVVNRVLLCPHYHQLHHSTNPKHYDRNFGLMLSLWDRLFGTLSAPDRDESFTFGLPDREAEAYQSLHGLYVLPLRRMAAHVRWRRKRAS